MYQELNDGFPEKEGFIVLGGSVKIPLTGL
jgi:hypothetical protein